MRNLLSLFGLVMLLFLPTQVWADCSYPGSFTLEGSMGNGINFKIHAAFWGDNPCLVVGETVYLRQNGKTSNIPIYGHISDEVCVLTEIINGKVCGRFNIEMPGPGELQDIDLMVGQKVSGSWFHGEKEYDFNDVRLMHSGANPDEEYIDYDQYLHHPNLDYRTLSGRYGSYSLFEGDTIYSYLNIVANCDSVSWHSESDNEMAGWTIDFSTPGLDPDFFDHENRCFSPKVDDGEYQTIAMDNVLMLTRTNDIPEETDNFIDLDNVYPKLADYVILCPKHSYGDKNPDACSYYNFDLRIPRTGDARLDKSIRNWVCNHIGVYDNPEKNYWQLANEAAQDYFETECIAPEPNEEGEIEIYKIFWREREISYFDETNAKYINMTLFASDHTGGIHPFSRSSTTTIRRSDGKVMEKYEDWFTSTTAIRAIVEKYMREQNVDVDFDSSTLALPEEAPYFSNGGFVFHYCQYEAAPYCYGMPECVVPVKELLPYLTDAAKRLVK